MHTTTKGIRIFSMKKNTILLAVCLCAISLFGQNGKKNTIGAHIAYGIGDYGYLPAEKGANSYNVKYYYSLALDYSRQLSKRLDLCSGVEYSYDNTTVTQSYTGQESDRNFRSNLTLITVPVQIKYHAGKFIYFNGGMFFNILSQTRETAEWFLPPNRTRNNNANLFLGLGLGIGLEHTFDSGIMVSLNPYARWNGIVERLQYVQAGVSLGIGYKF